MIGLQAGRDRARSNARRRRRANSIKNIIVGLVALAAVGAAGYVGWAAYEDSRDAEEREQNQVDHSPRQAIEILERQSRWNGPGNPTFGVGSEGP